MADLKKEIELIDKKIKQATKELGELRRHRKQLADTQVIIDKMHGVPGPESSSPGTETPPAAG